MSKVQFVRAQVSSTRLSPSATRSRYTLPMSKIRPPSVAVLSLHIFFTAILLIRASEVTQGECAESSKDCTTTRAGDTGRSPTIETIQENNRANKKASSNTCTLYLAPSSIPNSGYGIFTTKAFREDSFVLANDGPNIAVIDPFSVPSPHLELFGNVWWGELSGMSDNMRFEAEQVTDYQIGFGALPNFHPYLYNLKTKHLAIAYDDTLVNRNVDPGSGAFTYYTGKTFGTSKDVQAGDELFLDYGEAFLNDRSDYDHVPREKEYVVVGEILAKFSETFKLLLVDDDANEDLANMTTRSRAALQKSVSEKVESLLSDIHKVTSVVSKRIDSIVPSTLSELKRLLMNSGLSIDDPKALSTAVAKELSINRRSIDWIKQNGQCLDNMIPGRSKIFQAGRGGMAQRFLSKGEIIVPVPMLHITNKDVLGTHAVRSREGGFTRKNTEKAERQLLFNYCFGHPESSLLLVPVTNALLINHCSLRTRECGEDGPNAEYRWSTESDPNTKEWLTKSLDDIKEATEGRILSLDIVATRNIQAGEEIFIDYGSKWEAAWDQHVAEWKQPSHGGGFDVHESSKLKNENIGPFDITSDLRNDNPTFEGDLFTACWYWEDTNDEDKYENEEDGYIHWKDLDDIAIISRYGSKGFYFKESPTNNGAYWPCSIVARENDTGSSYTVRIFQSKTHQHPLAPWAEKNLPRFLTEFPGSSVRYFTKPYKSDQHLPGAFRSHIEIRDAIFPDHWKDRKAPIITESRGDRSSAPYAVGDRIQAKHTYTGQWYEAIIVEYISDSNSYSIEYDDGEEDWGVRLSALRASRNTQYLDLPQFLA